MALPSPVPGLVIRYSYLWASEHARGREEGIKERPAAFVLVTVNAAGGPVVTVLPITHTPPGVSALAVEIPHPKAGESPAAIGRTYGVHRSTIERLGA